MCDYYDNYEKLAEAIILLAIEDYRKSCCNQTRVYKTEIPYSVKAAEISAVGKSLYTYNKNGKAADAYKEFSKEVLDNGKQRNKHRSEIIR